MYAVLQHRQAVLVKSVPPYPVISRLARAYERWEEASLPQAAVRSGIAAERMNKIWGRGIKADARLLVVRDAAMCMFAYGFNGLRDSSVPYFATMDVDLRGAFVFTRLKVVKGRNASRVPLVGVTSIREPFMMNPWREWSEIRDVNTRFFGLGEEPETYCAGNLIQALMWSLEALSIFPPTGGKYTSDSLRIAAHNEQVLLGLGLRFILHASDGARGALRWRPSTSHPR